MICPVGLDSEQVSFMFSTLGARLPTTSTVTSQWDQMVLLKKFTFASVHVYHVDSFQLVTLLRMTLPLWYVVRDTLKRCFGPTVSPVFTKHSLSCGVS